ncbi:MAG: Holliday junction branch migration protein RuvA [Bdellovibrionales bacterium]
MIGKLRGVLDHVTLTQVLLDVSGVGYVVTCSARTLRRLGAVGTAATLLIETHVREDAISLFGFADAEEQEWFRLLTTVQGVGAKVALAILGAVGPERLAQVIVAQDKTALTEADGVGPKLALRVVTELKDKVAALAGISSAAQGGAVARAQDALGRVVPASAAADAVSALVNLGYRRAEAFAAVARAARAQPDAKLDALIRVALAELSGAEKVA